MRMDLLKILNPIFGGFPRPRHIRRFSDGQRVDWATEQDLRGLSEHTLRDIGFTSTNV